MTTPTAVTDRSPLVELIRSIYLGGRTGCLQVMHEKGRRVLYFSKGELYLPTAHPLAVLLGPHLGTWTPRTAQTAATQWRRDPELAALMARIARTIMAWEEGAPSFEEGRQLLPKGLLGPLPTSLLVMEQAVAGLGETELEIRLGGGLVRLRAVRSDREIVRAACLDEADFELLQGLKTAMTLSDVLAGRTAQREELLRRLCGLEALGLIERLPTPGTQEQVAAGEVARRLAHRVARSLEERPFELDAVDHRHRLADLVARLGDLDHYQLLELATDAPTEAVHGAFEKLARLVHPSHARRLDLEGQEGLFDLLLERATDAYLTLSDPRRRGTYNRDHGIGPSPQPRPEKREAEKRELARRYYRQASEMAGSEDFHFVVELLKQAVRYDPQPAYYALMGQVQAMNPNWLRQAADSLEKAIARGAEDLDVRLKLARIYEDLGWGPKAERIYTSILEQMPEETRAQEGLSRLTPSLEERSSWWRRLLGGERE